MKSTKFEITRPGEKLEDVEKRVVSQGKTFLEGGAPKTPKTKAQANEERLAEGMKKVEELKNTQSENGASLEALDTLTNTEIKDMVDVTNLDLSDVISFEGVDWAEKGLPNPADYGVTPESLVDLTGIDGSNWPLPKPALGAVRPDGCITLDDILDDLSNSLTCTDARDYGIADMDFSDSRFDDYDWNGSPQKDRSCVSVTEVTDSECLDFSGLFDFSDINWPDLPDLGLGNPFKNLDLSGVMDDLKGIFEGMGDAGDLFGLGMLTDALNGVKCVGKLVADALVPDALVDAMKNFDIPDFDGSEDELKGAVVNALAVVDIDAVIYYKKNHTPPLYNYTNLSQVSEKLLSYMADEPKYREVVNLATSIRGHYNLTGG